MLLLSLPLAILQGALILAVSAQQQNTAGSLTVLTPTPTSVPLPTSTSYSTGYTTYTSIFATTLTSGQPRPSGAHTSQSVFLATTTVTSAIYTSPSTTAVPSPTASVPVPSPTSYAETGLPLHTVIDPAFGILGVLLILTGLTLAFIGHRARWLLSLISGFYTFALVTLCVILRVGVARAVDDPDKTLKGIYLLACICAGGIGGAAFVIFRQGGLLVSCALGGFASALFLQAFKSNGLIEPVGLRYILYLGLATLAFSLACHSRLQAYILILSSALVGATTVILGIDCYTRANLKEFYVRNLGFDDLFEKKYPDEFSHHRWFLSTASIIELGVIGALFLMAVSFQGKMWAEFRASVQMMRHDDEERRMQAKAKRAAKKIFASAQKDLQEWEERHGYRKTATRTEVPEEGYVVQNVPSSDMVTYQPKGSAISLLPMKAGQGDTPIVEYPPTLAYEPTLAESMGLLTSPTPGSDSSGTAQEKQLKSPLSTDQQTLLDEIANIRKSIDVLRSASPRTAMSASSEYQDVGRRASSASYLRQSRDEPSARTPSPWLTKDRARSQIITTRMQESTAVNPDLFAGVDRTSPYLRSSSPGVISPIEEPPRPSSAMLPALPRVREPSSEGRARADSDSRLLQKIAKSPNHNAERRTSHSTAYNSPRKDPSPTRIITETPDEAAARYAKSLGRTTPKSRNQSRKSSEPSTPVEYTKKATTLSMGELQARHESRMRALQRPTSKRVQQEASLIKAKEDWTRRSMLEKKRWDNIEREQRRESMPMEGEERPRRSTRSKSMMLDPISPPPAVASSQTLQGMPEQSGVSRAKEWRQSIKTESKQHRTPDAMRRRHSAHSQPLLHFEPEAIPEEAKQQF